MHTGPNKPLLSGKGRRTGMISEFRRTQDKLLSAFRGHPHEIAPIGGACVRTTSF